MELDWGAHRRFDQEATATLNDQDRRPDPASESVSMSYFLPDLFGWMMRLVRNYFCLLGVMVLGSKFQHHVCVPWSSRLLSQLLGL